MNMQTGNIWPFSIERKSVILYFFLQVVVTDWRLMHLGAEADEHYATPIKSISRESRLSRPAILAESKYPSSIMAPGYKIIISLKQQPKSF